MSTDNTPDKHENATTGEKSNKAHMLVAMLGQEFTKSADHPFFAKLNSIVATPDPKSAPVPKGALERLLASLPTDPGGAKKTARKDPVGTQQKSNTSNLSDLSRADAMIKNLCDQHPAVIAHYLVNNAPSVRMEVINSLKGQTARQAAVYFTRFLSRLDKRS